MTQDNKLIALFLSPLLRKRAIVGAVIAFVLLVTFLCIVGAIDDGSYVFIPLLTVFIGGACGGVFYHLAEYLQMQYNWNKIVVIGVSLVVYFVGLWLSLVFGLSLVGLWD